MKNEHEYMGTCAWFTGYATFELSCVRKGCLRFHGEIKMNMDPYIMRNEHISLTKMSKLRPTDSSMT